ncbi:MAG: glycosyltransferase [Gloeocapsa sp. UFS-A4-WI-NPMV-4B04]|jgi:UDP:flavonoid glycosyltransferase YjiC (YdhE family)|nr:glycosyltransferase [Gloeocapsa sp. UFS-A4-WI-NPMV-4B04]
MGNRIVLTTYGSLGDLHPYMAIALELQQRGHHPVIATHELYRSKVEAEGLEFYSIRPDIASGNTEQAQEIIKRAMHPNKGTEYIIRELILPYLKDSYEDLMQAVSGADLLVTHPITYAGPIVAEKTGIRWVSGVLAPSSFLSAYDPPVLTTQSGQTSLKSLGPLINSFLLHLAKLSVRSWSEPVRRLRAELSLSQSKNPVFEGQHSPHLVLALFSQVFAQPQLDWPKQTCVTGFPFYDRQDKAELTSELSEFLNAGSPPIVFTLGSSAVLDAGNFYTESAIAAKELGHRAVLLIGQDQRNKLRKSLLSDDITTFDYAPYSKIFPRSLAIVHQGGIGTTVQALRSGRPMLIMPYSIDQPDNAARAERLGVARTIKRTEYNAVTDAAELKQLLNNPKYTERATEVGQQIQLENGVKTARDAIEARLNISI